MLHHPTVVDFMREVRMYRRSLSHPKQKGSSLSTYQHQYQQGAGGIGWCIWGGGGRGTGCGWGERGRALGWGGRGRGCQLVWVGKDWILPTCQQDLWLPSYYLFWL